MGSYREPLAGAPEPPPEEKPRESPMAGMMMASFLSRAAQNAQASARSTQLQAPKAKPKARPNLGNVFMAADAEEAGGPGAVYLGLIPPGTSEGLIRVECGKSGTILSVYYNDRPAGVLLEDRWAVVTFASQGDANKAVEKLGRRLTLFGASEPVLVRSATAEDIASAEVAKASAEAAKAAKALPPKAAVKPSQQVLDEPPAVGARSRSRSRDRRARGGGSHGGGRRQRSRSRRRRAGGRRRARSSSSSSASEPAAGAPSSRKFTDTAAAAEKKSRGLGFFDSAPPSSLATVQVAAPRSCRLWPISLARRLRYPSILLYLSKHINIYIYIYIYIHI